MTDDPRRYLFDILHSIRLIEEFMSDTESFEEYIADQKTQSSVERQLEIIGEAVNKYRRIETQYELSDAHEIVGFRNRLIHNNDGIDESIIWAVLLNHLPKLKSEVEFILKN